MKIYLVYGACDGFGNDNFLYTVTTSLVEAKEKIQETTFMGKSFKKLSKDYQQNLLTDIEKIKKDEIVDIEIEGIFEVEI